MKWKKPSGLEIETSNGKETVEYCKSLGWKRVGGKVPKDEPKPEDIDINDAPDIARVTVKGKK